MNNANRIGYMMYPYKTMKEGLLKAHAEITHTVALSPPVSGRFVMRGWCSVLLSLLSVARCLYIIT